jgi:putative transposase
MKTWLTARDLAGLPGMPGTERRTRERLLKLNVPSRARAGRGGGQEFDCSKLPAETRTALMIDKVATAGGAIAAHTEALALDSQTGINLPAVTEPERRPPSQADKAVADARVVLVTQLLDLQHFHGIKKAVNLLALQLSAGTCSVELKATARTANQRARDNSISTRTLQRWLATYRTEGWWGLLPAQAEAPVIELDDDVAAVLGLYHSKDAQFRNLSDAAKDVTRKLRRDFDTWTQLYAKARRALPKLDKVGLIKARHSGSEAKALLPHKRRDTSVLKPLDVFIGDGHTFKAKVRHPDHGAPFAPEVTAIIDAASRKIVGWSVSLSENTFAVGDALRHAVGNAGVPAIIYSDNGAGQTGKQIDCPITGVVARLGSEHRTGIPGNPQARGLIERSWSTWLIRCARQFGSYQGGDVDAGTLRKAASELAKEQRAVKRAEQTGDVIQLSTKAPSWKQFIDAVQIAVDEYNTQHRHRSLPKHANGPHAGKHMTPAEAWDAMLDTSLQHMLSPLELRMLFMPAMLRTAKRGEVTFFNQTYFARDLMAVDGTQVRVHYDIHDPSFVLVFTTEGEYVCQAEFAGNRVDFFPKPVVDMAREKRVKTALKRLSGKQELALRELQAVVQAPTTVFLPASSALEVLVPLEGSSSLPSISSLPEPQLVQAAAGRPFFDNASDRYEWLMQHRAAWGEGDGEWIADYVQGDDYGALREYFASRGLDWKDGEAGFKSAR